MVTMQEQIENAIDMGGGQVCNVLGVIRELAKAGFVIVPRNATPKMLEAMNEQAGCIYDIEAGWKAAIEEAIRASQ